MLLTLVSEFWAVGLAHTDAPPTLTSAPQPDCVVFLERRFEDVKSSSFNFSEVLQNVNANRSCKIKA